MGLGDALMKIVVKVNDVVALARRFREAPGPAMAELVTEVRAVVVDTLEQEDLARGVGDHGVGAEAEGVLERHEVFSSARPAGRRGGAGSRAAARSLLRSRRASNDGRARARGSASGRST